MVLLSITSALNHVVGAVHLEVKVVASYGRFGAVHRIATKSNLVFIAVSTPRVESTTMRMSNGHREIGNDMLTCDEEPNN